MPTLSQKSSEIFNNKKKREKIVLHHLGHKLLGSGEDLVIFQFVRLLFCKLYFYSIFEFCLFAKLIAILRLDCRP